MSWGIARLRKQHELRYGLVFPGDEGGLQMVEDL